MELTSNNIIQRAYQLWEDADTNQPRKLTHEKIVSQIFKETQLNHLSPIRKFFYTLWFNSKVKIAKQAYKFDLFISNKPMSKVKLFNKKELWFLNQKISPMFKNTLITNGNLNLNEKAYRWKVKTKKYYNKPELLIGSLFLYQLKAVSPKLRNVINCIPFLPVEKLCKQAFEEIGDDGIVEGVIQHLGCPFDSKTKLKTIFFRIGYHSAIAKAKRGFHLPFDYKSWFQPRNA